MKFTITITADFDERGFKDWIKKGRDEEFIGLAILF